MHTMKKGPQKTCPIQSIFNTKKNKRRSEIKMSLLAGSAEPLITRLAYLTYPISHLNNGPRTSTVSSKVTRQHSTPGEGCQAPPQPESRSPAYPGNRAANVGLEGEVGPID